VTAELLVPLTFQADERAEATADQQCVEQMIGSG
jgi:hypothetical protein